MRMAKSKYEYVHAKIADETQRLQRADYGNSFPGELCVLTLRPLREFLINAV